MKIDLEKIAAREDIVQNFDGVLEKLDDLGELFIISNNKPRCVLISIEEYENLKDMYSSSLCEDRSLDDVFQTLNKIGKQIFVDYYYVFKNDDSPEEKLPKDFTLNSKKSRTSNARKLFREKKNISALEVIMNSDRLDTEVIKKAKIIHMEELLGKSDNGSTSFNAELLNSDEVKIGRFAKDTIVKMIKNKEISEDEIYHLTTLEYSKTVFNMNFPVLKEVIELESLDRQKKDSKGYNRYYNMTINAYGKRYLLCSQWVEDLHRSGLNKWLASRGNK